MNLKQGAREPLDDYLNRARLVLTRLKEAGATSRLLPLPSEITTGEREATALLKGVNNLMAGWVDNLFANHSSLKQSERTQLQSGTINHSLLPTRTFPRSFEEACELIKSAEASHLKSSTPMPQVEDLAKMTDTSPHTKRAATAPMPQVAHLKVENLLPTRANQPRRKTCISLLMHRTI